MLKFFGYFKDGAIIQRGEPIFVKGYADGEVKCTLSGGGYFEAKFVAAKEGRFSVTFKEVNDTEHVFVLTAECGEEKVSAKVRFGDVYLALGQSNMSYCLSAVEDYESWWKRTEKVKISLLDLLEKYVPEGEELQRPAYPQENFALDYDWAESGNERLKNISALSVQTAVLLAERENIPVGFVHTAMGGLSAEAYLRRELAESDVELLDFLKRAGRYVTIEDYNTVGGRNYTQIEGVWNEKIAPMLGLKFKGIVWYLGESSAWDYEFAQYFLREMKLITGDFRHAFGHIPFVAVQIAPEYYPYGDKYGYLYINEALTALQGEADGVIALPIYDIEPRWRKADGDLYFHPIHTVNKAPVAARIADALDGRRTVYPQIAEVKYGDGEAVCSIKNAKGGLSDGRRCPYGARGEQGRLNGFTIAGADGKYYQASATLDGERIRVFSRDVPHPNKLTYAFMQYQDFCNAADGEGAPLLPYRTDGEPVDGDYCFPPAHTVNGALSVYENNFGWQVGTCRKVEVWKKGTLYDGAAVTIGSDGDGVSFTAAPTAADYFFFGASPALCLAGHKSHIADYKFWNFQLKADGETEFCGVVFRTADGEIYRFELMNGETSAESLPVGGEFFDYAVNLEKGRTGDDGRCSFTEEQRRSVVEAEFLFRAKKKVTVRLKNSVLSDLNFSLGIDRAQKPQNGRTDMKLPENSDR